MTLPDCSNSNTSKIGFPFENFGEDRYYSNGIKTLIKSEVYIKEPIYIYNKKEYK